MKTFRFLCIAFLTAFASQVSTQVTVSLGTYTGASSSNSLLSTSTTTNKYSRTLSIYTASEIITAGGVAGTISSLAWDKNGTGEYLFNDAYIKIYLKHTSLSVWASSPVPDWTVEAVGATEVFTSSTYSLPSGTGWKTIPFTTPFVWNGTDNLVVMVEWYRPSTPTADISWGRSTTTSGNATRVGSTSLAALVMLINANRPLVQLTITPGAPVPVTGLTVSTLGSIPAVISTNGGTLQMAATVVPAAANQAVNWSIVPGTGAASISTTGLVTAIANGTIWAKAISIQNSTIMDSLAIAISNQIIPITSVAVNTLGSVPPLINQNAGSLSLQATILPAGANQAVSWSIVPVTGAATITAAGVLTAQSDGAVWGKAVSVQDLTKKDSILITITNQIVPVTSLIVNTSGSIPALIDIKGGTLQMEAIVLPSTANQGVNWVCVPGTGSASIDGAGLVTALINGTVWAKAISIQNALVSDSLMITITNQDIGIAQTNNSFGVTIYPNPTFNQSVIIERTTHDALEEAEVMLFDLQGKCIQTRIVLRDETVMRFTDIQPGLYFIRYCDTRGCSTQKINVL
jgi:hypothetical protein